MEMAIEIGLSCFSKVVAIVSLYERRKNAQDGSEDHTDPTPPVPLPSLCVIEYILRDKLRKPTSRVCDGVLKSANDYAVKPSILYTSSRHPSLEAKEFPDKIHLKINLPVLYFFFFLC